MMQPVWKIISQYDLQTSPHLPEIHGLALAEVDRTGTLRSINGLGAKRWKWQKGARLPGSMLTALQALSALNVLERGAAQTLPMQQGGLSLIGVSLRPERGWLIIGHTSQKQLAARASTFKSLIEKVSVLVLTMRADGMVIAADAEAERITGYTEEEIKGRAFWLEVVHPEDRWKLTEALRRASEGQQATVSVRFFAPNHELRLASLHLLPTHAEEIRTLVFDITDQREVEAALMQSEALYRTFLEQSPMGILHLDAAGLVTFENYPFRKIIGEDVKDAWVGRGISSISGLDPHLKSLISRMLEQGDALHGEPAIYRHDPDAPPTHLIVHGSPIRQQGNVIVGGVLMVEDVTEKRRHEDELLLRDRYAKGEAALREAVLADLNDTAFLKQAASILGETILADRVHLLTQHDAEGNCTTRASWGRDTHPPMAPLRVAPGNYVPLGRAIEKKRSLYLQRDTASKKERPLLELTGAAEAIWAPFFDAGRLGGFVVIERTALMADAGSRFWQRTELYLIHQIVRLFETLWSWIQVGQRYRLTVETIDDCIFSFSYAGDDRRRYLMITQQIEHLTGYSIDHVLTQDNDAFSWADTLVDERDRELVQRHDESLREGCESRITFRVQHRDGTERWLCEHSIPVTDATGQVTVSGILMDVTEQKAAEEVLRNAKEDAESASRLKSAFVATMSHEIRTPLGAISGFAELLGHELQEWEENQGAEMPEEIHEFVEAVQQNAHKLLLLADDLFVLSNLEIGNVQLARNPVPLHAIVQQEAGKIAFRLAEKSINLRVELTPGDPIVLGDEQRIRQVISNLLGNAAKFTDTGSVLVRTELVEEEVMVEVLDSGVGIAEEHLGKLFTPFLQEDNRLNRRFEGTGLGLALVKRLLDLMDGRITVDSKKGVGSIFRVYLPSAEPQRQPPRKSAMTLVKE